MALGHDDGGHGKFIGINICPDCDGGNNTTLDFSPCTERDGGPGQDEAFQLRTGSSGHGGASHPSDILR
jgi:hypothetical protein